MHIWSGLQPLQGQRAKQPAVISEKELLSGKCARFEIKVRFSHSAAFSYINDVVISMSKQGD